MIKWQLDLWNDLWERSDNRSSEEARGERQDAGPVVRGRRDGPERPCLPFLPPTDVDPSQEGPDGSTSR